MDWEFFKEIAYRYNSLSPDEFWGCRVRDIIDLLVGALWKEKDREDENIALAWKTAALQRKKRLPKLKKLLKGSGNVNVVKGEQKEKLQEQHEERLKRMGVEQYSDDD